MTSQLPNITVVATKQQRMPKESLESVTANPPDYNKFLNFNNMLQRSQRRADTLRRSECTGTSEGTENISKQPVQLPPLQVGGVTPIRPKFVGLVDALPDVRGNQTEEGKAQIPAHVIESMDGAKPPISFSYNFSDIDVRPLKTGISAFCGTASGDTHDTQSIVQWPLEIVDVRKDPCKYPMRQLKLKEEADAASSKSKAASTSTATRRFFKDKKTRKNVVMDALYPGMPPNDEFYDDIRIPSVRNVIESKRELLDYVSAGGKPEDIPVASRVRSMQELKIIKPPKKETPDWQHWYNKHTGQAECRAPVIPTPLPVYEKIEFSNKSMYVEDSQKRFGTVMRHKQALETIRFGIPCDLRDLVDIPPLYYLARFAKLKPVKITQYDDVYRQFMIRASKDPYLKPITDQRLEFEKLPEALNGVLSNNMTAEDWLVVHSDKLPRRPLLETLDFQLLEKRSLEFGLPHPLVTVMLSL